MSDQQYGRRAVETGPTGRVVAENLARLRQTRSFSTRQLSAALEERGRSISPSGITRMEKAERHVTTDELVAFAAVFGVSPSALLLPLSDDPDETVQVTGGGTVQADVAWDWMDGKRPLEWPEGGDPSTSSYEYRLYSRPPGRREAQGVVLRPRGRAGQQQVKEIREAYRVLSEHGLDLRELQRLDVDAFEHLMGERDDG